MTARLISRLFQLIRALTIAKWLGPEEFGVFAVASLVMATLEQFSETGLRPALIQRQGDITPYLLPVRTVQAVRGMLIGIGVFFSAPLLASFFNSPNSLHIIRVMALMPIINGFEPLYIVLAQKELHFKPIVILQMTAASISLVVGIIAAYLRPDAWALVLASLTGAMITTVGAHLISEKGSLGFSFRWKPLKDIRRFGFWILMTSIVSYMFIKGGDWMIGRMLDVKAMALYQMTFMICTTMTQEIGGVVSQLSFPVFSKLQNDPQRLQTAFRASFGTISIVTLGLAGLLVTCAPDFYPLVLGEKWLPALPLVPWLTVWGVCGMFGGAQGGVFSALNKPKIWTTTVAFMVVLLVIGVYPMTRWMGALGVAILIASIGMLMQLVRYRILGNILQLSYVRVLLHVLTPTIACIFSVVLTNYLHGKIEFSDHLFGLAFSAVCLLVSYIILLTLGKRWIEPSPKELVQRMRGLFIRLQTNE